MDWSQLEKYRPIPGGGRKVAAGVIVLLLLMVTLTWRYGISPWIMAFHTLWVLILGCFVYAVYCIFSSTQGWLQRYLWNNIIGYYCRFWINAGHKIDHKVGSRWSDPVEPALSCFQLIVPLGGWGAWGTVIQWKGPESDSPQWRVRRDGRRPGNKNPTMQFVVLDDGHSSVSMRICEALEFLEFVYRYRIFMPGQQHFTLACYIEYLMVCAVDAQQSVAQLGRVAHEREDALKAQKAAECDRLADVIRRLGKTTRFMKSSEARDIRLGLIRDLFALLDADDPRREEFKSVPTRAEATPVRASRRQ